MSQISDATQSERILNANEDRLTQMARQHLGEGRGPVDFVLVCLDIGDPGGLLVARTLSPGETWPAPTDSRDRLSVRAVVPRDIMLDILNQICSRVAPGLRDSPPRGQVHVVVICSGETTVFSIVAEPNGQPVASA